MSAWLIGMTGPEWVAMSVSGGVALLLGVRLTLGWLFPRWFRDEE